MVLKKSLINTVDYSYTYCAGILGLTHSRMFPSVGLQKQEMGRVDGNQSC